MPVSSLRALVSGFCMGAADLVPGVSGGTVALILGIYEKLIGSIKSPLQSWRFLVPLLAGIALAFLTLSHLVHFLLGHPVYRELFFSVFFGLIVGSVWYCMKLVDHWTLSHCCAITVGVIAAFFVTTIEPISTSGDSLFSIKYVYTGDLTADNYHAPSKMITGITLVELEGMEAKGEISKEILVTTDLGEEVPLSSLITNKGSRWVYPSIFFSGIVAICAMLLPGISGSYVLVILGVYPLFVGAVADFSTATLHARFDLQATVLLCNLGFGAVLGALLFSRVISWLLRHYHGLTLATLIGLMVGALRAVWPFWNYAFHFDPLKLNRGPQLVVIDPILPDFFSSTFLYSLLALMFGYLLVFGLEKWAACKS